MMSRAATDGPRKKKLTSAFFFRIKNSPILVENLPENDVSAFFHTSASSGFLILSPDLTRSAEIREVDADDLDVELSDDDDEEARDSALASFLTTSAA